MACKGNKTEECHNCTTCLPKRCSFITDLGINEHFDNEMLMQILCCLPYQSVIACKSVCKLWLSLISSHSFAIRFISRHDRHHQQQNYLVLKTEGCYFLPTSEISKFNISFSFLPEFSTSKYEIVASFDDMLLMCCELDRNTIYYFICNPFTKGWVKLPLPPLCSNAQYRLGFTCEPYYKVEGDRVVMNSSCRFRVVRLKLGRKHYVEATSAFEMDIFSSETWQWTTAMMCSPLKVQPIRSTSHNGLLYWMCFFGEVLVHDPFNNTVCYAIHPPRHGLIRCNFRFSISEGSLLAFQGPIMWGFKVWELEDWDQREWRLKSVVALKDHVLNASEMLEWTGGHHKIATLALDPSDKNIMFVHGRAGGIATINLRTRVFKPRILPKLSQKRYTFFMPPIPRAITLANHPPVFEIKTPCCPTPISAFFYQALTEPSN